MTGAKALSYLGLWFLLAAYYLAFEREPPAAEEPPKKETFLDLPASQVQSVKIEIDGQRLRCQRTGDRWSVIEPAGAPVFDDLITAIVSSLTDTPPVELVDATGASMDDFGLSRPTVRITLGRTNQEEVVIELGARNPAQTAVYARRDGSPSIVLLGLNVQYYVDLVLEALPRSAS